MSLPLPSSVISGIIRIETYLGMIKTYRQSRPFSQKPDIKIIDISTENKRAAYFVSCSLSIVPFCFLSKTPYCARDGNRTRTDIAAHRILSPACLPIPPPEPSISNTCTDLPKNPLRPEEVFGIGAENETRTRDPNLGKVMLYQLSYFRVWDCKVKTFFECSKKSFN